MILNKKNNYMGLDISLKLRRITVVFIGGVIGVGFFSVLKVKYL